MKNTIQHGGLWWYNKSYIILACILILFILLGVFIYEIYVKNIIVSNNLYFTGSLCFIGIFALFTLIFSFQEFLQNKIGVILGFLKKLNYELVLQFTFFFSVLILISVFYYLIIIYGIQNITDKYNSYLIGGICATAILSVCIWTFVKYKNITGSQFQINFAFNFAIMGACFVLALLFYTYLNVIAIQLITYIFTIILICLIIVSLAIIFKIFYNYLKHIKSPILQLIIEFIFYIPCLFLNFLNYFSNQLNITPYVTYILLIIEAVLILLYIYYPKILNALFVNRTKYIFQNEPYYLDNGKEKTIASIGDIHFQSEDLINGKNPNGEIPYSKNYGISFWVQINPRTISSNNEIQIFKFGSGSSCKPMLTYSSKSTNEKDIYKIYLSSTQKSDIDIHLPNQIWNHFFFQYNSTNVDLYINGVFERHVDFKVQNINIPVYQPTDIITVGNSGSYKINGAICNVVYFANTLSDFEIKNLYNLSTLLPYPQIL